MVYRRRKYRGGRPRASWDSVYGKQIPQTERRYWSKYGPLAGFYAMNWVYDRQIRAKYYSDYYKNTGKRPKYYNKITGGRRKW